MFERVEHTFAPNEEGRPWLSVVLPTYHGERWIKTTLDAIACEPDCGIEIVVVDTSTNSATLELVRGYGDRLTLSIYCPRDIDGCSLKTNFGVARAKAPHITWLCQDDLWLPGRAQAIRSWIAADPEAVLHLAPTAIIDENGRRLGIWKCPLEDRGMPLDAATLCERLVVQNFIAVVSPVVRRDAWLACGGIDAQLWYTGDWDLWLKLARYGKAYYHDAVTAAFRIHGQSATSIGSRNTADFQQQHEIVVDRHIDAVAVAKREDVRRLAAASIAVNTQLAASANGDRLAIVGAVRSVLALGPARAWHYIQISRIFERALPRFRARLAGAL